MDIVVIKNCIISALAAIGSAVSVLLGGWDTALQTMIILMGVDYVTGIIIALVFKKSIKSNKGSFESGASIKGLFRKFGIILIVLVACQLDNMIGTDDYTRNAVILFFSANEGLSIVENLGIMGLPMPSVIKNAFEVLKKTADKELGVSEDANTNDEKADEGLSVTAKKTDKNNKKQPINKTEKQQEQKGNKNTKNTRQNTKLR